MRVAALAQGHRLEQEVSDEARDQEPPRRLRGHRRAARPVGRRGRLHPHHERLRFPFIESTPFTLNAEFSTAQAVTPGQGQTVRVSGVQIGEIGGVKLQNGMAVVSDADRREVQAPDPHRRDRAAAPSTGLKDMFIELNPGSKNAPVAKPGYTIPVSNTQPGRRPRRDPRLARRRHPPVPRSAGQRRRPGPQGQRRQRARPGARALRADPPRPRAAQQGAWRAGARISAGSSTRCGVSTPRWPPSRVRSSRSSTRARRCSMRSPPRTATSRSRSPMLPGTLSQTTSTLQKVQAFANELGPTATKLLPAARALPAANQALTALAEPSTPIIKNEIRPFVVAARPLVRNLRPAAVNLAKATPNLAGSSPSSTTSSTCSATRPGGSAARLPVVAGLARPQRPHRVLGPGCQRRLSATVSPGQLRHAGPGGQLPGRPG